MLLGVLIFGFQRDLWISFKEELLDSFEILFRGKTFKKTFVYGREGRVIVYFILLTKDINAMNHVKD